MMPPTPEPSIPLRCYRCGYDLRAHRLDEKCPECGTPVAESQHMATIPRRPLWRDSDPRWRRRMLAGVWVLVLLPLMDTLGALGWGSYVPVPNVLGYGAVRTLSDTFLWPTGYSYIPNVYEPLIFCIGAVLLFSKERGRRRNRLDWTRRWGVICGYVVFVLSAVSVLFIPALVLVGIAAIFLNMPPKYQPGVTQLCIDLSTGWLRYGPQPKEIVLIVLTAFSAIVILLACIPLFDGLRSSGCKRVTRGLIAPLALFALFYLARAGWYGIVVSSMPPSSVYIYRIYFWPEGLVGYLAPPPPMPFAVPAMTLAAFLAEAVKWCIILTIAIWLTLAQLAARRERTRQGDKVKG